MAKRIFVAFAIEDEAYRNLLKGQALNTATPFEYTDMSVKEPWDTNWKERCRVRIKGCHGTIVLLSKNSLNASGERWEITCSIGEKVPTIGMYIHATDTSSPPEMAGVRKINWDWSKIAAFIDSV